MAAQAALGDWENIISAHINGAPLPVMMDAVRDAAIEFCRDTRIDRRLVKGLRAEPGKIDILIPNGEDDEFPGTVITVWSENGPLDQMTHRDLESMYPRGYVNESVDSMRALRGWISQRPGTVRLVPYLQDDTPGVIDLQVAYQPKRNASGIAQFIYEMYAYEIGWGALAILHAHEHAAYATPERAGGFRQMFLHEINRFADKSESGFGKPRRSTRYERFR